VVFYLTVLNSVHDEIGDQLLSRSRAEQDRANMLKDKIRERDVQRIAQSWQEILTHWRTTNDAVAELCLKAVGKWISWIDISFVVNQQMLELLFQQLERAQKVDLRAGEEQARDAAIDVFTETVAKKMPSADKVNMITFLNLETVVSQLVACPPLSDSKASNYDVDLAETVAKLVNTTVVDIVKVLETENQNSPTWAKAEQLLASFLPHLLRFFSDVFDEVCSTVLGAMNDVLSFLRRASQGESASTQRAAMLVPILKAIFSKMRYDDTADWGQEDEQTDEAEFQDLRKRLAGLQSSIASADEQLYIDAVSSLVHDTFERLRSESTQLNWRDLDLALHEVYLIGDLAVKGGGLYQKNKPNSPAAEKLVRMMLEMVQSGTDQSPIVK
jgi:exportin-T